MKRKIFVPLMAVAIVAGVAGPAQAYGAPPVWITGNSSDSNEWTVSSLGAVNELNAPQTFTGGAFAVESLAAFDIVYSGAGNFAYAIGANTEDYYRIDLDHNTMEVVWSDLGTDGDDNIDTLAMNGEVAYVTYKKANGFYAVGTINNTTGSIDFVADIDPYKTPRSLAYFDGMLYVIDGGYGLNEDFVLRSVDLATGQLTELYTLDQNIYEVFDGDIDNNGDFHSLSRDNDDRVLNIGFNVLTESASLPGYSNGVTRNPMAFWGAPGETVATRGSSNGNSGSGNSGNNSGSGSNNGSGSANSGSLANTGSASLVTIIGSAFVALAAGAYLTTRRRRSRT